MNKKFLSLVLALVMVLGTFGSVFAAEAPKADAKKETKKVEETKKVPEKKDNNEKVQWLVDNGIVNGRKANKDEKNNDLALDKNIQRAEITKLLVYAIGREDLATKIHGQVKPYSDVKNDHWANGYITVGTTMASPKNALPFLHGYVDGSFKPENDVTYVELAKMLVVLVKDDLTQADFKSAVWPRDWMAWAAKLGILDGVKVEDSAKAAVRQDAFVMLYNALYKLGELVAYPAHETMGIISDASANKLVLNQGDFKKEFTVNASTNFVPANYDATKKLDSIKWFNAIKADRDYYVGSLVRVLADDKGNITHIVQLGNPNPKELAIPGNGWEAVASHVAETNAPVKLGTLSELTLNSANVYEGKVKLADKSVTVETTDTTRYFVADNDKEVLTEVKDKAALLALYKRSTLSTDKGVYVGYNVLPNAKVNEAKVVVVHDVDESNISSDIVRVTTPGTLNYVLEAEKPGYEPTKAEKFDLRDYKAAFPVNYGFDTEDVVDLGSKEGTIKINRSEDPVYEILEVEKQPVVKDNYLTGKTSRITTLKVGDKGNGTGYVDLREDAKVFFGIQLKEGAKIQLHFEKDNLADIVSVVDKDTKLKGFLPDAVKNVKDAREVKAEFISATELDSSGKYTVKVYKIEDGTKEKTPSTFEVRDEGFDFKTLVSGQIITFNDLKTKGASNLPLIGDIKPVDNPRADAKAKIAKLENLTEDEVKAANKAVEDAETKTAVEKAVKDAKDLNDINAVAKEITKVVLPKGSTIDKATVEANLPTNKKDVKVELANLDTTTAGSEKVDLKLTKGDAKKTFTGITVEVAK